MKQIEIREDENNIYYYIDGKSADLTPEQENDITIMILYNSFKQHFQDKDFHIDKEDMNNFLDVYNFVKKRYKELKREYKLKSHP